MPYKSLSQMSFFTPEFADPGCLPEGSVGWVLRVHADIMFPDWLFGQWHGAGRRGRPAWPTSVLLTALILASREGITSRRGMVRRLQRDTSWRAACGLEIGGETPDEATFRRFERYLRRRDRASGVPRELLLHEYYFRLCLDEGVLAQTAAWMMDSTPMWCFGTFHGTFRLLGDLVSGLIASVCVTPANVGDGRVAHRLIDCARTLYAEITQVLGDTAYGGAKLRLMARRLDGVDILAPPPPVTRKPGRFSTDDFDIDLAVEKATCPAGVTVGLKRGRKSRHFSWRKATCTACPLRSQCVSERTPSKTIFLA